MPVSRARRSSRATAVFLDRTTRLFLPMEKPTSYATLKLSRVMSATTNEADSISSRTGSTRHRPGMSFASQVLERQRRLHVLCLPYRRVDRLPHFAQARGIGYECFANGHGAVSVECLDMFKLVESAANFSGWRELLRGGRRLRSRNAHTKAVESRLLRG